MFLTHENHHNAQAIGENFGLSHVATTFGGEAKCKKVSRSHRCGEYNEMVQYCLHIENTSAERHSHIDPGNNIDRTVALDLLFRDLLCVWGILCTLHVSVQSSLREHLCVPACHTRSSSVKFPY